MVKQSRRSRIRGYTSIEDSIGKVASERHYKLAFFTEGKDTIAAIKETTANLISDAFNTLVEAVTIISFVFLVFGLIRIKGISKKMTIQVVSLLESCEEILRSRNGHQNMKLTFRPSTAELNKLHLTFNKVARAISIAHTKIKDGEEVKAILNYNEAYHIFKDFKNERQMSVCISNIAGLHMQIKSYQMAAVAYDQATESMKIEMNLVTEQGVEDTDEEPKLFKK